MTRTAGDRARRRLARDLSTDPLARDRKGRVGERGEADREAARSFLPASPEGGGMTEREERRAPGERAARDRTEAGEPEGQAKRHVPFAQMDEETQKEKAPGKDEHAAGGQGLSG